MLLGLLVSSLASLNLPLPVVAVIVGGGLGGSFVNIPVRARTVTSAGELRESGPWVFWVPAHLERQVLAVNLGGAVIPALVSCWLVTQAPLWKLGLATAALVVATHRLARIKPGSGIVMPLLAAPLLAATLALLLSMHGRPAEAPAIAYVAGSMGTLISADLLNLGRLRTIGSGIVSIGGAGVLDGVFLVGLVAVLLT
jgi:uncharacterized membrane protein